MIFPFLFCPGTSDLTRADVKFSPLYYIISRVSSQDQNQIFIMYQGMSNFKARSRVSSCPGRQILKSRKVYPMSNFHSSCKFQPAASAANQLSNFIAAANQLQVKFSYSSCKFEKAGISCYNIYTKDEESP